MKEIIKNILVTEFTKLINHLTDDIKKNYILKNHNFLLSELDEAMTAHLVFVSSFESKSGNVIQECARQIAEIRYGKENVPKIINPSNYDISRLTSQFNNTKEQVIITNSNLESQRVKETIKGFMTLNQASGKGRGRAESNVNQETIKTLLDLNRDNQDKNVYFKPVDLAFNDGGFWHIMEIKAGGNLDSSNAPSNVEKLLSVYVALNQVNSKIYFSTYYNKDGEGNVWKGAVKKYLGYPDMFLIGSEFWRMILPVGIDFEQFKDIYSEAMNEIGLNEKLNEIIRSCIND
jgi:hypothetical protein